jgi:hypothetical protein
MKTPQAIFGALVVALALAAFITFYDNSKPDTQTAPHANEVAEKMDLLTPASSIAHDFAQLPKSVHSTSAISIAEEFAELPKSIHIVPVRSEAPRAKQAIALPPLRRCPHLAMPIRSLPQHCLRTLNPTSARAMAAIASTLCAAIRVSMRWRAVTRTV